MAGTLQECVTVNATQVSPKPSYKKSLSGILQECARTDSDSKIERSNNTNTIENEWPAASSVVSDTAPDVAPVDTTLPGPKASTRVVDDIKKKKRKRKKKKKKKKKTQLDTTHTPPRSTPKSTPESPDNPFEELQQACQDTPAHDKRVHFSDPLVSAEWTRERTLLKDIASLYYSKQDCNRFKRNHKMPLTKEDEDETRLLEPLLLSGGGRMTHKWLGPGPPSGDPPEQKINPHDLEGAFLGSIIGPLTLERLFDRHDATMGVPLSQRYYNNVFNNTFGESDSDDNSDEESNEAREEPSPKPTRAPLIPSQTILKPSKLTNAMVGSDVCQEQLSYAEAAMRGIDKQQRKQWSQAGSEVSHCDSSNGYFWRRGRPPE